MIFLKKLGWLFLFFIYCCKNEPCFNDKNCVYIVLKGSNGKFDSDLRMFNTYNTPSTHIGIGIYSSSNMRVYHVTTKKGGCDNFYISTLNEFLAPNDSLYYYSVYKLSSTNSKVKTLTDVLEKIENLKYDYDFVDSNGSYYCSEFVIEMLANVDTFNYKKKKFPLKSSLQLFYFSDSIDIYPIDVVKQNKNFKLIFENSSLTKIK